MGKEGSWGYVFAMIRESRVVIFAGGRGKGFEKYGKRGDVHTGIGKEKDHMRGRRGGERRANGRSVKKKKMRGDRIIMGAEGCIKSEKKRDQEKVQSPRNL